MVNGPGHRRLAKAFQPTVQFSGFKVSGFAKSESFTELTQPERQVREILWPEPLQCLAFE
jgi:hypothetical protein